MVRICNRLWRYSLATIFFSLLMVGCRSKVLNPETTDKATIDYIVNSLQTDLPQLDSSVASVERIKLTRQDDIPIALTYLTYKDGTTTCDFIYFSYEDICSVYKITQEQPQLSAAEIAAQLPLSEVQVKSMLKIIKLANEY